MTKKQSDAYKAFITVKAFIGSQLRKTKFYAYMFLRKTIPQTNKFAGLEIYKNIHNGKRCFIIATGPSLTIEDIEKIKNEYTFAMNSFVKVLDDISYTPTYYGIQDGYVYDVLKEDIKKSRLPVIFMADAFDCYMPRKKDIDASILQRAKFYPLNENYHRFSMDHTKKYHCRFSDDITIQVYDGSTITYSLLQIAVYMGFKEIYLIGADCNYQPGVKNFADHGIRYDNQSSAGWRMTQAYKTAKQYADNNGVKIYNATRGGQLEVFERVDLDEILAKKPNG